MITEIKLLCAMLFDTGQFKKILSELSSNDAILVAVSKTKSEAAIMEAYQAGQRIFGENYVREMVEKEAHLPNDIAWHFIGHLQSNKVKLIATFVSLVHGVDSFSLLKELNKHALKNNRIIDCLLQIHIATEETKFGLSIPEAEQLLSHNEFHNLKNICVRGLMGMASLTSNRSQIKKEFQALSAFFHQLQSRVYKTKELNGKTPHYHEPPNAELKAQVQPVPQPSNFRPEILSMGMSSDYKIALLEGSTMVRIGSLIFGER